MKKILLMLALMLPCLGVMAQNATTHADGVYKIFWQWNGRGYLTYHADYPNDPQLAGVTLGNYGNSHYALTDAGIQLSWYLYTSPQTGKTYLFEATTGKFITINTDVNVGNGKKCTLSTEVTAQAQLDLKATTNTEGYMLSYDRYNFCSGCGSAKGQNPVRFATDGQTDGGIPFVFVSEGASITDEVKNAAIAKINQFESPEVELNYTLTDASGNVFTGSFMGHAGVDPTFTGVAGLTLTNQAWEGQSFSATVDFTIPVSSASTKNQVTISPFQNTNFKYYVSGSDVKVTNNTSVTNHLWEIYPSLTNGEFAFQIKNVATGKYISTSLENNTAPAQGNVTVVESEGTYFTLDQYNQFKVKGKNVYLSTDTSTKNDQYATAWSSHNGTKNTIALIKTVNLVTYILTDNAGNTYTTSVEGTTGGDPVFTGVEGYTLEDGSWNGNTYTATITFPFATSSETQSNPILIRQDYNVDKKVWTAVNGGIKVVNDIPSLGASQWMIYPSLNGTEFTFKIKSVSTEKYVTATTEGVTLTTDGTNFKCIERIYDEIKAYGLACTNENDETLYVTNGYSEEEANNTPLSLTTNATEMGNLLVFPEFNQFKVVIGEAGYTTVYSPLTVLRDSQYDNGEFGGIYTIAEEANYNEEKREWKVPLVEASYYIPANSAAILKGKGTFVFTQMTEEWRYPEADAIWENNNLKGSSVNTYVAEDAYTLSAPEGVESIGLYQVLLNKDANGANGNTHFLNNAGKAYILASDLGNPTTTGTSSTVRFSFGSETTAIESVVNNGAEANAPIYDLSGRRVANAVKGGIYIQNGKKVYIK